MNIALEKSTVRENLQSFLWQHFLLAISLFIMTLGVALSVRSGLGSSVISTIPFVMTLAGEAHEAPALTIGEYTYIMNFILVGLQILILRRSFQMMQLFQLVIGFLFGFLLDINMWLTSPLSCDTTFSKVAVQLLGCVVLAAGISLEIRCGSVTMPGEGITVAVNRSFHLPFAKAKIIVDTMLVVLAVVTGYYYFGSWQWHVVGIGTLIAMVLVGAMVKWIDPKIEWFSRLLYSRPGFKRVVYGLARHIYRRFS